MFKKLKNRFILTNLILTSFVLISSYTAIYLIALNTFNNRRPIPPNAPSYTSEVENILKEQIKSDRQKTLNSLLVTLIVTGIATEFIVFIISKYLAEEAIKPVKHAYEAQKDFIANASHEIKTPLAVIQANLEAAEIKDNHWIDNVSTEVEKLSSLNKQLTALSKSDIINSSTAEKEVNLKKEVDSVIKPLEPMIKNKKITLKKKYDLDKSKTIKLNSADFSEILTILLDNAIKYCDKRITINTSSKEISIKNDGTVIPKEKITHIFDRFYQVNKTKSGVGLGLAIAKSLAERNSWNLTASSDKDNTIFTLSF